MNLAEILLNSRKIRKLSLRSAAGELDISFTYLADLEKGRRIHPKMMMIHKLAQFYGLSEDRLCIISERIPRDVFYKVVRCPALLEVIRNYPEG